jgi:sirohydrochlorin cobaltochelatase
VIADDSEPSRGILLIGHGSRDQQGTKQFFQLADRLAESVSPMVVEPALLEFQEPTIPQAWHSLVAHGVQHIHVAPLLLFAAGHAKQDIPDVIEECRQQTPNVTWNQSHPLSRHPSVVESVVQQVRRTLANGHPSGRTALIMVGRGNRDPCAQADMRVLSELVDHRVESVSTYTAFYAMAEPKLTDVLDSVAASDAYGSIIVHPHLLFEGRLHQAITEQTQQVASKFSPIRFEMSPYLGPSEHVAQAIADRVSAAATLVSGDVDR